MILIDPMIMNDDKDNEVWKPLSANGQIISRYLISNHGHIYDMEKEKYCFTFIINSGYEAISLITNDGSKSFLVHRLVAENFVCHPNINQNQVNHTNGNKLFNKAYNLEWNTPKENTNHAFDSGLANNNIGENSHLAKFTNKQVENICELLAKGMRYKDILINIGMEVTPNNLDMIGNIYRGIAWKRISSKYSFPEYDDRFSTHDKDTIENICKCIESGMSNKEVCQKVFGVSSEAGTRAYKQEYELVRMIRNKKYFTDVS